MTFLNTLILKNRNRVVVKRDETGKLSNFEMEDSYSETDHNTCSSRTDEADLILFAESNVCFKTVEKERRKEDRRSSGSTKIRDRALLSLSHTRASNTSSRSVSTVRPEEKATDLSECDVSISNLKIVEEASHSDRVIYGYGEAITEEDLGTGARTRSASMPLNEMISPHLQANRVVSPETKACRSTSLSHKQSNIRAGKEPCAASSTGRSGPRALSLSNGTRQPPISSLFTGANSPRRPLSPRHVTKPLARVAEIKDASREKLMSPILAHSCAPSTYETLGGIVPSSKAILLGSNSANSFGCMSFDESSDDDDSDDDLVIETEEDVLQSGADISERSYGQRGIISDHSDSGTTSRCSSRPVLNGEGMRDADSSGNGSDRVEEARSLAKTLLGISDLNDSLKEDKSPRSPRRVVRGNSGFFVLQEDIQITSRLGRAKLLVDKDEERPSVGDGLSRSDHTHQNRSSMGPLSRSEHTSPASRPRLLKTESALLMYTKHEDLLAVYENIIGAEDMEGADSEPRDDVPGVTKRVASSVHPTSRRIGLQKAQSAPYCMAHDDGGVFGMTKASRPNERRSGQKECFASPSRSGSRVFDAFQSPFKKKTSNKSGIPKERRKTENFASPNRSSSLLSSWKRISPSRKSSGLALMSPLPILQSLVGTKIPKKNTEEGSCPAHNHPQDYDATAVGAITQHNSSRTEHNNAGKGSVHSPQRTRSLYSNLKLSASERDPPEENCSARMTLPMIDPLPGIPQADKSPRRSIGLRKAASLHTMSSKPSGAGLVHLFEKYSAIVESPSSGSDMSGWK